MLLARTRASASSPSPCRFATTTLITSSTSTLAEVLDLRPLFLGTLVTNAFSSFLARLARASLRSLKLITFAFPKIRDLVNRRTLASLLAFVKNAF